MNKKGKKTTTAGGERRGRKSLYNPDIHPQLAGELAQQGKTQKEIARAIGISEDTLKEWKKRYPEFSTPIKIGKEHADELVIDSLYKKALGGKITEKKMIQEGDERTEVGNDGREFIVRKVRKEITEKEVPADPTAAIFWLCNRQPDQWRRGGMGADGGQQIDIKVLVQESNQMMEIFKEALRSELDPESIQRVVAYIEKRTAALADPAAAKA